MREKDTSRATCGLMEPGLKLLMYSPSERLGRLEVIKRIIPTFKCITVAAWPLSACVVVFFLGGCIMLSGLGHTGCKILYLTIYLMHESAVYLSILISFYVVLCYISEASNLALLFMSALVANLQIMMCAYE